MMDEALALTTDRLRELHADGRRIYKRIPWWNLKLRGYVRWKLAALESIIEQRG